MKYVYICFVLFCSFDVYCQEINNTNPVDQHKKGYNLYTLSYASQYYKDNKSVKYNNQTFQNQILPENTIGHNWGLQYERVTRYGLILSLGLSYGVRNYNVSTYQNLSNYDNEAQYSLRDAFFRDDTKLAVNYWAYKLMLGYKKQFCTRSSVIAKMGVEFKTFRNGLWENLEYNIEYQTDDGLIQKRSEFVNLEKRFGTDYYSNSRKGINTFECYLGIDRSLDIGYLKNITVGLEANRNWWMWLNDGQMTLYSNKSFGAKMSKTGTFYDRNISIGLRIGVGISRRS